VPANQAPDTDNVFDTELTPLEAVTVNVSFVELVADRRCSTVGV
jgi:hypothetical protein